MKPVPFAAMRLIILGLGGQINFGILFGKAQAHYCVLFQCIRVPKQMLFTQTIRSLFAAFYLRMLHIVKFGILFGKAQAQHGGLFQCIRVPTQMFFTQAMTSMFSAFYTGIRHLALTQATFWNTQPPSHKR